LGESKNQEEEPTTTSTKNKNEQQSTPQKRISKEATAKGSCGSTTKTSKEKIVGKAFVQFLLSESNDTDWSNLFENGASDQSVETLLGFGIVNCEVVPKKS
jgi:hypothetical protein